MQYGSDEFPHDSPVGSTRYASPKTGGAGIYQPEPYFDSTGSTWYTPPNSAYAPQSTPSYHVGHTTHLAQSHDHYAMSPVGVQHMVVDGGGGHLGQNRSQTLPPMSSFRGATPSVNQGPQAQNSPAMYNQQITHPHNHPHSQHSPALQNDTLVGKALQTVR